MNCKQIAIVGLGLIGGSLLKALQGFSGAEFFGIDANEEVILQAKKEGLLSEKNLTAEEILLTADVTLVCLPPMATVDFINHHTFKKGALVTDVCGVKQSIYAGITNKDIAFLGGHPMAGKEAGGFLASSGDLFQNASYLMTPTKDTKPEHIAFMEDMTAYIGCRELVKTTPEEHDRMIAYTSQLMHVVAVSLCDSPLLDKSKDFSAGSLRDCTRVAKLDSKLWTQLFMLNSDDLTLCIDEFINSMNTFKAFLAKQDTQGMQAFLEEATQRKLRFLSEQGR